MKSLKDKPSITACCRIILDFFCVTSRWFLIPVCGLPALDYQYLDLWFSISERWFLVNRRLSVSAVILLISTEDLNKGKHKEKTTRRMRFSSRIHFFYFLSFVSSLIKSEGKGKTKNDRKVIQENADNK